MHERPPPTTSPADTFDNLPGGEELEAFGVQESDELAAEAARGRTLDHQLTEELEHRTATTRPISGRYLRELGQRARMPAGIERLLVREAIAGDRIARGALVEAFLPLIGTVARNYRTTPQVTRVELMQEGVVGLLRALERFDPELGVPFWAYASWWVRQAMQQLVSELSRPMVLSDRALRQLSKLKDAHAELAREHGRAPTLAELADRAGLEPDQLANLIAADRPPKPLEEPLGGEEGATGVLGELIADPLAEDEYEHVISHVAIGELRDLLSGLSDRERAVLHARFGLDGHQQSLREIAGRLGVSPERVRQLENRALGKLRAAATGETHPPELTPPIREPQNQPGTLTTRAGGLPKHKGTSRRARPLARVLVTDGSGTPTWSERVTAADFASEHFRRCLGQRLQWAVQDAEHRASTAPRPDCSDNVLAERPGSS